MNPNYGQSSTFGNYIPSSYNNADLSSDTRNRFVQGETDEDIKNPHKIFYSDNTDDNEYDKTGRANEYDENYYNLGNVNKQYDGMVWNRKPKDKRYENHVHCDDAIAKEAQQLHVQSHCDLANAQSQQGNITGCNNPTVYTNTSHSH